jgi:hypothetical protein
MKFVVNLVGHCLEFRAGRLDPSPRYSARWEALTRLKKFREELKGPGRAQSDQNGPEVTAPREWGGAARLEARLTWAPMNKSSCAAATALGRSELHRAGKRNCGLCTERKRKSFRAPGRGGVNPEPIGLVRRPHFTNVAVTLGGKAGWMNRK